MAAAPQEQKQFPTNPVEVLAINDAHRRYDVGNADLWTADEIHGLRPMAYDYKVPTFAPRTWPTPRRITQAEYSAEFSKRHPIAARVLRAVNAEDAPATVIAAGGAAASPYYESGIAAGDVDFFVVGVDPADRAALWRAAHGIVRTLRDITQDEGSPDLFPGYEPVELAQKMTPGLITLTLQLRSNDNSWRNRRVLTRKYQIILRAYPSESAVIHAFDVGSCCVAYDGTTARATTLGAFAQLFRINLVNPDYRSTTYEKRLVKYFERYYALGLVHLKTGVLVVDEPLELPHLVLTPAVVRGNRATGTAGAPPSGDVSDYDPVQSDLDRWYWDGAAMATYAAANANLAQLSSGRGFYTMVRCTDGSMRRRRRPGAAVEDYEWLPFEAWYGEPEAKDDDDDEDEPEPTFKELLPRPQLDATLDKIIKGAYDSHGRVRAQGLAKYLGMTNAEVAQYVEGLMALAAANPGRQIDATAALQPFRDEIVRRYEVACETPIEWWITVDPGRQYTASLNPRVENPAMWYGEERVERNPGEVSRDVYVESLLAALESKQLQAEADAAPVYDGNCALCLTELPRGVANSVTLPCGHTFHWSRNADTGCEGLYRWTLGDHSDCPTCRNDFGGNADGDDEDAAGAAMGGPIVLMINWLARGAPGVPPGGPPGVPPGGPSEDSGDE
jgi:hypothetical protein